MVINYFITNFRDKKIIILNVTEDNIYCTL